MELHPQLAGSLEDSKPGWFVVSPIAVSPYLSIFIHISVASKWRNLSSSPRSEAKIPQGANPHLHPGHPAPVGPLPPMPAPSWSRLDSATPALGRREGPARSEPTRRTEWLALEKWWRFWGIHHVFLGGIQRIHCIIPPKILVGV